MRAQSSHVFLFILIAIVIGMLFLFGYIAINKVMQTSEQVSTTTLLQRVSDDFASMIRLRGSSQIFTYRMPGPVDTVCFVVDNEESNFPAIEATPGDNFFLLDQQLIYASANVGPINASGADQDELCLPVRGPVTIRATGFGDLVQVEQIN